MKISVKTLEGTSFVLEVKPEDKVSDVKENIEKSQGACVYPADQQMLIYQGKVLKDTTTLEENNVVEESFVVIMLTKKKSSSGDASTTTAPTTSQAPPTSSAPPTTTVASTTTEAPAANLVPPPAAPVPAAAPVAAAPFVTSLAPSVPAPIQEADVYGQVASNLVAGNNFEEAIQQILDMGGGTWDRDTVIRALRAAFNNPERAVDYLYSGIPEQPEVPPATQPPMGGLAANLPAQAPQPADPIPPSGPNANPLNLFPQDLSNVGSNTAGSGNLDFLRNNVQFQDLRSMVQANPEILQPMLQELGKQNPQLVRLIKKHQAEFLNLINEPVEGEEDVLGQLAAGMPQQVAVTPEERYAIEHWIAPALEWMKETKETNDRLMKETSERLNLLDGFVVGVRDGIQSDIQVKPGNGLPIPAHRAVLALRSDIFKIMLESDGCKAAPIDTISLPELNHDELESLIEFLYDGNLAAKKIEKHVYSLFIAADKYEIPHLQKSCERQILKSLDSSNAFDVLEISDVCKNTLLKEAAMSFVLKNKDDIVFSTKFEEFSRKNPHLSVEIIRALFRENDSKRKRIL